MFWFVISTAYELTGLSRGGQQVSKCKEVFGQAVKLLVELASLQVRPYACTYLCDTQVIATDLDSHE